MKQEQGDESETNTWGCIGWSGAVQEPKAVGSAAGWTVLSLDQHFNPLCLKKETRDSFSLSQDKILKLKPPGCPDWIRFTHILGTLI